MNQREKLIELLTGYYGVSRADEGVAMLAEWLIDNGVTIQEAAEWEETSRTEFKYDTEIEEKCSACGRHVERYETQPQDEYCPSCGRKMVLPEPPKEG